MLKWSPRLVPTCGRPIIQDMKTFIHRLGRSPGAHEHSTGRKVGSDAASWAMILEQGLALRARYRVKNSGVYDIYIYPPKKHD